MNNKTLISEIFRYSDEIRNERDQMYVLSKCIEELGELSTEIQIHLGYSYKKPGPDGVIGEEIDLLTCVVDIIRRTSPELTEEDLICLSIPKIEKW